MSEITFGISDVELSDILKEFIIKEHHHIKTIKLNGDGDIQNVIWDPRWINHNIICPGKKKIKHHICRKCNRIALRLLGDIKSSNRICLECGNYNGVPSWYFKKKKNV